MFSVHIQKPPEEVRREVLSEHGKSYNEYMVNKNKLWDDQYTFFIIKIKSETRIDSFFLV